MEWLLFYMLCAQAGGVILWALLRAERFNYFPLLTALSFCGFALPQLYGLLAMPQGLPPGGLVKTLAMANLCFGSVIAGFGFSARALNSLRWSYTAGSLLFISGLMTVVGSVFYWKISRLPAEELNTQWSGAATAYNLFAATLPYGLVTSLYLVIKKPGVAAMLLLTLCSILILDRAIMGGHRSTATEYVLTIILSLWLFKGVTVPRPVFLGFVIAGSLVLYSIGDYRAAVVGEGKLYNSILTGGNFGAFKKTLEIPFAENMKQVAEQGGSEYRAAVFAIADADEKRRFDYGLSHWNEFVRHNVPAQLVGRGFQKSLMFNLPGPGANQFGFEKSGATSEPGIVDAFRSFWYFGCLEFFLIGVFMRLVLNSARAGSVSFAFLYIVLVPTALLIVSHPIDFFVQPVIHVTVFLGGAALLVRILQPSAIVSTVSNAPRGNRSPVRPEAPVPSAANRKPKKGTADFTGYTAGREKRKFGKRDLYMREMAVGLVLWAFSNRAPATAQGGAGPPEVCQFTTPGPLGGELWLIQGHHFVAGQTQVLDYLVPGGRPDLKATNEWLQDAGKAEAPPATPPEGSRALEIVDATPDTLVVRGVGPGLPLFIFWVRTPAGVSAPQTVNRPEPYWTGRRQMAPGETGMIFGKACLVEFRAGLVALKSRATGRAWLAGPLEAENNRTGGIVPFRIPEGIPPGLYDVWVHNGSGGESGWGGPLQLEVTPAAGPVVIVDARKYEAKGDGMADDTEAIQRALDAAAQAARKAGRNCRAAVALAPGTYNISSSLIVPPMTGLKGSGSGNCILRGVGTEPTVPGESRLSRAATPAAVVQLGSRASLLDLTITGQTLKGAGDGNVQIRESRWQDAVTGASIRNCRIAGQDNEIPPSYGMYLRLGPVGGVRCGSEVDDLEICDCRFEQCGIGLGQVARRARIVRCDAMGIGGGTQIDCYFARNRVHGGIKGMLASIWPSSSYHNLYALNEVFDVANGREGSDGEEILMHGEGGAKFGRRVGMVTAATEFSLTDGAATWTGDEMKGDHVAIISGRGRGQYRLIAGNTRDTVSLDRPWAVTPDSTSSYLAAGMFVENTFLCNTTGSGSWMLFYKGNIGNIVDGHETDRSAGIGVFTNDGSREGKPEWDTEYSLGWYNQMRNCILDHASVKFLFQTDEGNARRAPTQMGNKVIGCTFRDSLPNHNGFTGSASAPIRPGLQGAILFARDRSGDDGRAQAPADPLICGAYAFIEKNSFSASSVGVAIFENSDRTFVTGNSFWDVEQPLLDLGTGTRFWDNYRQRFDQEGRHYEPLPEIPPRRP
jgi:hypothetical protein